MGASVASFVSSWQLDLSPLKAKIKMKVKKQGAYIPCVFSLNCNQFKLLTGVNWYDFAALELKAAQVIWWCIVSSVSSSIVSGVDMRIKL